MSLRLADRWIWDSWFYKDEDTTHAFYLSAPKNLIDPDFRHRNPTIGHAISKDLVNWEVLPDALVPEPSQSFDSWTTWTGSVVRDERGLWWMFYTGTSREDGGDVQRIGAATSEDSISWHKVSTNALVEADANWYELLDKELWHDQAWRDPWVFQSPETGTWHMLVTARANLGDPKTRAVVGHAISRDLSTWNVEKPLSSPGQGFGQYEVIQFENVDGVPILTFCCGWKELGDHRLMQHGKIDTTYSLVATQLFEGLDFRNARPFLDSIVYAGRLVRGADGFWNLIGFIGEVDGKFVGELSNPIPVTANHEMGLIPREV